MLRVRIASAREIGMFVNDVRFLVQNDGTDAFLNRRCNSVNNVVEAKFFFDFSRHIFLFLLAFSEEYSVCLILFFLPFMIGV